MTDPPFWLWIIIAIALLVFTAFWIWRVAKFCCNRSESEHAQKHVQRMYANKAKQGILLNGDIDNNGEMENDLNSLDCGYTISNEFTNCTSGGRNLNVTTSCTGGNKTSVDTEKDIKRPIPVPYGLLGGGSFHSGLENSSSLDFESSHRGRTVSQTSDQWSNEGSMGSSHETGGMSTQKTAVEVWMSWKHFGLPWPILVFPPSTPTHALQC